MVAGVSGQRHYVCYYAAQKPVIDGSGDEPVWQRAPWTEDYTDIEGNLRPRPAFRTRTKMLWDKEYLYIYTELEEPDLWATLRQHDTIIYDDNDFEIFINPDNSTHNYFELEINAVGTVMDLFLARPYRNGGKPLLSWDTQGLLSAVQSRGTINHPGDVDQSWSVEMAIPLKSLIFWGDGPPGDGSQWRINFSRVEWDRDVQDGQYVPRVRPGTRQRLPEHNWVWSPQGIIDMHAPEMWGYLQFSLHAGGSDTVAFVQPADAAVRGWLWKVYAAQLAYRWRHGRYAGSLEELGIKPDTLVLSAKMKATDWQYMVSADARSIGSLSIDQDGEIRKPKDQD
jgi:hypothetical protein